MHMKGLLRKARELVWLEGDPDRDQSTGLIVFGTLEIMLGILAFSVAMCLIILVSASGLGGMKSAHFWMLMGMLCYLTGWFIVMGLGSIKAARWARVLVLVGSWVTIFFGTMAMALLLYILPGIYDLLADSGVFSPSTTMTILSVSIVLLFILQLILPMGAIAFYSLKGVQTTCERLNPSPCWSDHCPLPLLAMGFIAVLGSLSIFVGSSINYVVFLFGTVLAGWQGFLVVLLLSAVCIYVGWGALMRRMHAWWMAYAVIVLTSASMMLSFSEVDMNTVYRSMGYAAGQIAQLGQLSLFNPAVLTFVTCVWGIMASIYLVWVRDCFIPERSHDEIKSYRQRKAEEDAGKPRKTFRPRMRLD